MLVLDTHAFVWWLGEPRRLSRKAARALAACRAPGSVRVSSASVLEVVVLAGRGRLRLACDISAWLADARRVPQLAFEPISAEIAALAGGYGETVPADPMDRLILATAAAVGAPLVTADERLAAAGFVRTVW